MKLSEQALSIDDTLTRISLESNMGSNMSSTISSFFPNLLEYLSTTFKSVEGLPVIENKYTKEQKFIIENMQNKVWMDMAELAVVVPEGFNGNIIDYGSCLETNIKAANTVVENVLKPYAVYLSQFISNKDSKLSTKDLLPGYKSMALERKAALKNMDKFKTAGNNSRLKISQILNRKPEVIVLFLSNNKVTELINKIDLKQVQDSVKQCVELLDIIVKQAQNNQLTNVSPETSKNLAFGATEIANEVSYLSILHYRCMSFNASVDNITEVLYKYIRGSI